MKSTLLRLCAGFAALVLLTQCASTPQSRIEDNPQLYSDLTKRDRDLVTAGTIREGMTRDAVFLAWGKPSSVSVGTQSGRKMEMWSYTGQRAVNSVNMGFGMGYGYGRLGIGPYWGAGPMGWGWGGGYPYWGGSSVTYVPYTQAQVEFTNGRVTRWMTTPR